jgi:Oxidoreductase-like protein, N-terminal
MNPIAPGESSQESVAASDPGPAPSPPEMPLASDCCGSGCIRCIFDIYADALDQYRAELEAWHARQSTPTR